MDALTEASASQIARALGEPTRFSIYKRITEVGETRSGDIGLDVPVRAPTISHHLKVLAEAGLIQSRRNGQAVYYKAIPQRLRAYVRYLRDLEQNVSSRMPDPGVLLR
jgi:ArsR family transcriptional regulator, arsenate/arsenite/antimonite-responsive transcriptional repressor